MDFEGDSRRPEKETLPCSSTADDQGTLVICKVRARIFHFKGQEFIPGSQ